MADEKLGPSSEMRSPEESLGDGDVVLPRGWKYRSPTIGSKKLPWYASPETQIVLVALVCFLCPGK